MNNSNCNNISRKIVSFSNDVAISVNGNSVDEWNWSLWKDASSDELMTPSDIYLPFKIEWIFDVC